MWLLSCRTLTTLARSFARRASLVTIVSIAVACGESTPAAPTPTSPVPTPVAPVPASSDSGHAVLYQRIAPMSYGMTDAYRLSEADSTFVIVFNGSATYDGWAGKYQRTDSLLVFHYKATNIQGELSATGIVRGDTLVLSYNSIMHGDDFEDGKYVRQRH